MADKVTEYIRAVDNAADYSDSQIENLEQAAAEEIDYLASSAEGRDEELWDYMGVDAELTRGEYEDDETRGIDWVLGLSGIYAAARSQFYLDEREETIIKPTAYRVQSLDGFNLTESELRAAGARGFSVPGVSGFRRIEQKYINELTFLREMSNAELYQRLEQYGAIIPPEQVIMQQTGYVQRMTQLRPGSPQFKEELNKLIDANTKRGLKSMNRRAVQQLYTVQQAGGNIKTLMCWIVEAGANTCDYCLQRAGEVKTYEQWLTDGMPGADVCKGGDLCHCQLVSV